MCFVDMCDYRADMLEATKHSARMCSLLSPCGVWGCLSGIRPVQTPLSTLALDLHSIICTHTHAHAHTYLWWNERAISCVLLASLFLRTWHTPEPTRLSRNTDWMIKLTYSMLSLVSHIYIIDKLFYLQDGVNLPHDVESPIHCSCKSPCPSPHLSNTIWSLLPHYLTQNFHFRVETSQVQMSKLDYIKPATLTSSWTHLSSHYLNTCSNLTN